MVAFAAAFSGQFPVIFIVVSFLVRGSLFVHLFLGLGPEGVDLFDCLGPGVFSLAA